MKQPNQIDRVIAKNLRQIRIKRDLSLQDVSKRLGIAYQQLQKYEMGINRISAGRLWQLSVVYRYPIQNFYNNKLT